jgi:hypothetical protein
VIVRGLLRHVLGGALGVEPRAVALAAPALTYWRDEARTTGLEHRVRAGRIAATVQTPSELNAGDASSGR